MLARPYMAKMVRDAASLIAKRTCVDLEESSQTDNFVLVRLKGGYVSISVYIQVYIQFFYFNVVVHMYML